MGGQAIKTAGVEARRVNLKEYRKISAEVKSLLDTHLSDFDYHFCRQLHDKVDFGDLDVIIRGTHSQVTSSLDRSIPDYLKQFFSAEAVVSNRGKKTDVSVVSWSYYGFQIDFIFLPVHYYGSACDFYSYNDLNLFLGSLYRAYGFKLGYDGLKYVYKDSLGNKHKILLSRDYRRIYNFGNLDYDRFKQKGFSNLDDVLDYCSTCRFFNVVSMLPQSLNAINRSRNAKRKNYEEMISKLEQRYNWQHNHGHPVIKPSVKTIMADIELHFPDAEFEAEIRCIEHRNNRDKILKECISGRYIGKLTGLSGPELGQLMKDWAQHIESVRCNKNMLDHPYITWGPSKTKRKFEKWYNENYAGSLTDFSNF